VSRVDFVALLPLLVLATAVIVVILIAAFFRRHAAVMAISQLGLALAFAALWPAAAVAPRRVTSLLVVDRYALLFSGLILAASIGVAALAYDYLKRARQPEEFYLLLLTASLGGMVLVSSNHFASFFLGLELLSVALFGLIAYPVRQWRPLEAGIKYLILSGTASAMLLFGMALIYGELGTLQFHQIAAAADRLSSSPGAVVMAGAALILGGIAFKLSLVPFHMWVGDVYEGAPAPVGGYLATVSKGAMFALLLRFLPETGLYDEPALLWILTVMALVSMLIGNLLALLQKRLKRLLAYSSVAHLGYLLVILVAGGPLAVEAAGYYLAAYFVTLVGAFGVISLLSSEEGDNDAVAEYRGLFWRHPWLAGILTLTMLSLAGIPVTMGFVAKFYVLAAGVDRAQWLLVYGVIVASAIGLYYYLRVIIALFAAGEPAGRLPVARPWSGTLAVLGAALLLLILGAYPGPLIDLLHTWIGPAV
jgi:NADH-quinone oxidoreductase subunit N